MTVQYSEQLLYNREPLRMCAEPLALLLEQQTSPWKFTSNTTALHRGYIGTWEIEGGRLYLKSMEEEGAELGQWSPIPIEAVFPGFLDGVFAHWFTGDLRCTRGTLLRRVHKVYGDIYEEDVFFRFQHGVLEKEWVVRNGTAPLKADAGYQAEATT